MEERTTTIESERSEHSPSHVLFPVPWNKRDIFWAIVLGVFVLLGLLVVIVLAIAVYQLAAGTESPPGLLITLVLVAELGLLLPVWALGVHKYRLPWSSIGFRRFDMSRGLGLGCLFLLAAFGFNVVWSIVSDVFGLRAQPDALPLFGGGIAGLLLALLAGGLVAPVAEEAFFRGYVFAGLRQHLGLPAAVVISAALFAVAHVLPTSWPPIFVLGVLFAVLYQQTGSIWPAIVVHGMTNTLAFLASYVIQMLGA
jgi:membrane protease YdiL (CAAX protease family)